MLFRAVYRMRHLGLREGQTFAFQGKDGESVDIQRPSANQSLDHNDCTGTVCVDRIISSKVTQQFVAATKARDEFNGSDGSVAPPTPPEAVKQESLAAMTQMRDVLSRAAQVLRWRIGCPGHHSPIRSVRETTGCNLSGARDWPSLSGGVRRG